MDGRVSPDIDARTMMTKLEVFPKNVKSTCTYIAKGVVIYVLIWDVKRN
jgi:hypothetical protein